MNHFARIITAAGLATLFFACARQGSPTGGPKDTTPPKVDTLLSTRNYSTHFTERRIELTFDEWVTLSEVGTQVIVSPTLTDRKRPEVKLKGKTVTVEIPEGVALDSNTTYTINFGAAVKDFHEGNPAEDLRFVFSTGDYLDSLTLTGFVLDAFSGEPVQKASVMLYNELSDSAVYGQPYYFTRTDQLGKYTFFNLRRGAFKLAAIEDSGDLRWDGRSEGIAYAPAPVTLGDSSLTAPVIKMFKNQPPPRRISDNTLRYGLEKVVFTARPDSVSLDVDLPGVNWLPEIVGDTLLVWYDMAEPSAWHLLVDGDSVRVKNLPSADFLEKHTLQPADEAPPAASAGKFAGQPPPKATPGVKTVNVSPAGNVVLPFNAPVVVVDDSRWIMLEDSVPVTDFLAARDPDAPRKLKIEMNWKYGKTYHLTLLPGAVTDFYNKSNEDTLRRVFRVYTEKQLGKLNLNLKSLVPGKLYVLQLLNGQNLETERRFEAGETDMTFAFVDLPPASYTARLIEDRNGNGRWDSGDYHRHRLPEPVFTKKLEALRANWELEATLRAGANEEKWGGGKKE